MEVPVSQTDCFCQCCQSNRRKHQQEILEIRDSHAENVRNMRDSIQSLMARYEETREAVEEARLDAEKHAVASQAAVQAAMKHIQEFDGLQREKLSDASGVIGGMGVDQVIENLSASLSHSKAENAHFRSLLLEAENQQQERNDSQEVMANEVKALTEKIQLYESERSRTLSLVDDAIGSVGDKEGSLDKHVSKMVTLIQTNGAELADLKIRYSDMESFLAKYQRFEEALLDEVKTDLLDKSRELDSLSLLASAETSNVDVSEQKMYLEKLDASKHQVENVDYIVKSMMFLLRRSLETCQKLSNELRMIQDQHKSVIRHSEDLTVERKMAVAPIQEIKGRDLETGRKVQAMQEQNEAQGERCYLTDILIIPRIEC